MSNINILNNQCTPQAPTDFNLQTGFLGEQIFKGYVTDAINLHGSLGVVGELFSSITDFFNFENNIRNWVALNSGAWPNGNLRGPCTSGTCGIFDYSISQSMTSLKHLNGQFVANGACPSITKGSNSYETLSDLGNSFALKGVAEYAMDGVGDDNGLCESHEICYFIPNAGALKEDPYTFTETCNYDPDGSTQVTDVTIYGSSAL